MQDLIKRVHSSPYVSIDFETYGPHALEGYRAAAEGVAIGWFENGEVCTEYFSFCAKNGRDYNVVTWDWFWEKILCDVYNDPNKRLVMHNFKFDLQIIIRRIGGPNLDAASVFDYMPKCMLDDTMVMAWLLDENELVGLKDLSKRFLGVKRLSYKQTEKEIKNKLKEGVSTVKEFLTLAWKKYFAERKRSKNIEDCIEGLTTLESWAMSMPRKLNKDQFLEKFRPKIEPYVLKKFKKDADDLFVGYARQDAGDTLKMFNILLEKMKKFPRILKWYETLEMPMCKVLTENEIVGIPMDLEHLNILYEAATYYKDLCEEEVKQSAREHGFEDFNPNSDVQLKKLIWDTLKVAPPKWAKKGKSGQYSTDKKMLGYLFDKHGTEYPFLDKLGKLGSASQLLSTFIIPLRERTIDSPNDRIRANWRTTVAKTGRLSSSPNAQNITKAYNMPSLEYSYLIDKHGCIPKGWYLMGQKDATEMKSLSEARCYISPLRRAYVAGKGRKFIVIDYSQIELRMIMYITRDPVGMEAYTRYDCAECGASGNTSKPLHSCPHCGAKEGKRDKKNPEQPVLEGFVLGLDLHSLTAVGTGLADRYDFGIARDMAKAINFGLAYGMSDYKLGLELGIPTEEAAVFHKGYFQQYKGIAEFHYNMKRRLWNEGFVEMVYGRRRRYYNEVMQHRRNMLTSWQREKNEREFINSLIQGSCSDILKIAMVRCHEAKMRVPHLRQMSNPLNVHDELVFECDEEHVEEAMALMKYTMENCIKLDVPFLVDGSICKSWDEGK